MTQPDPRQRLTAAIAALCDPTVVRVDRLATTDTDRDAVRAVNAEAAANHRDQIAFYRRDLARYQAQGDDAGIRRVTALIKHRETVHAAAIEARRTIEATIPSLLERLHDAVESTQGGGGASAGVHRSPIGLSAAELLGDIARESDCPRGRALDPHLRAWALDDSEPLVIAELLEMWTKTGLAIVEPARMAEIPRRCPACRTRYVWTAEGDEWLRRAALQINKTAGVATCTARACGTTWPKERWPLLAAALDQDDDDVDDMQTR